jgi:hypothetical protein
MSHDAYDGTTMLGLFACGLLVLAPAAVDAHARGNHAGDWAAGQVINVCPCGDSTAVFAGAITGAIDIWNASKDSLAGGVTMEWYLSLVDCNNVPAECDVTVDLKTLNPGTDPWGSAGAGTNPVEVVSDIGNGLNARGVQRILMHELGHVKGFGHSGLSDIMKWNYRAEGNSGPSADDLNGADAFETPNDDDIALNKDLHGIAQPQAGADAQGQAVPQGKDLWRYDYFLEGLIGSGFVDPLTRFTLELPSDVTASDLDVVQLPLGWLAAFIEGEPTAPSGRVLDVEEALQRALLTFWTDDPMAFGIYPGDVATFQVLSPRGPLNDRAFTNSLNFDTDEFELVVPGNAPVSVKPSSWGRIKAKYRTSSEE